MFVIIFVQFILLVFAVLSVVLGRILARGKGDKWIPGYGRTASTKYDIVRLRKICSVTLYFMAVILLLYGVVMLLSESIATIAILLLTAIILLLPLLVVIGIDKWVKKK